MVATWHHNLGMVLLDQGDLAKAHDRFERALAIGEAPLDPDHPMVVATWLNNLATVLRAQGDFLAAAAHLWRVLSIRQRHLLSFAEGMTFFQLGQIALVLKRPEAGLRLLAVTYTIGSSGIPMSRLSTSRESAR